MFFANWDYRKSGAGKVTVPEPNFFCLKKDLLPGDLASGGNSPAHSFMSACFLFLCLSEEDAKCSASSATGQHSFSFFPLISATDVRNCLQTWWNFTDLAKLSSGCTHSSPCLHSLLPSWCNWNELNKAAVQATNRACAQSSGGRLQSWPAPAQHPSSGCKGKAAALSVVCSCRNVSSLSLSFQCSAGSLSSARCAAFGMPDASEEIEDKQKQLWIWEQGCDMPRAQREVVVHAGMRHFAFPKGAPIFTLLQEKEG